MILSAFYLHIMCPSELSFPFLKTTFIILFEALCKRPIALCLDPVKKLQLIYSVEVTQI